MLKRFILTLCLITLSISIAVLLFAQEDGQGDADDRKSQIVDEKLAKDREKLPEIIIEEGLEFKRPPLPEVPGKVLISEINLSGATVFSKKQIEEMVAPFKNKELGLEGMQKIAEEITNAYRQQGYITSGAYISRIKIEQGILEIKVIEGLTGEISIEGNRYVKTSFLKKRIGLSLGEPFNNNILKENLYKINKHPDRKARVVVKPSRQPGFADIILKVKEDCPIHIMPMFDNWGSPNTLYRRYKNYFIHNNITGRDDVLTSKIQLGEAATQVIYDVDYTIPVGNDWELDFYALRKKEDYAAAREDADMEKRALKFIFLATRSIVDREDYEFSLNCGFVYKDSLMYMRGKYLCPDRLRAVMLGFDLDSSDKLGRTILSSDMEIGIPKIMGGMDAKDERSFFTGAGGRHIKNRLILARRHKLPWELEFLFKGQYQVATHTLAGVDKFAVGGRGGVVDNRGYPRSAVLGDEGTSATLGFAFPAYFVPQDFKVPFSKAKLYRALKLIIFYDWANARLKAPQPSEEGSRTLRSIGWGFRLNLPEKFSLRLDMAWPLDFKPADDDHCHAWVGVSKDIQF